MLLPPLHAAFACHHNAFLIYNSLKNKTVKTFVISSNISVFTSLFFLSMLGTLGFLTFQGNTQGVTSKNQLYAGQVVVVSMHTYVLVSPPCVQVTSLTTTA